MRATKLRAATKSGSEVNHFDKIKGECIYNWKAIYYNDYYFDTETFEYYNEETCKDNPDTLPTIIAYHIGIYDKRNNTYRSYFGDNAVEDFLNDLFNQDIRKSRLHAFNMDYDFQVIRPNLEKDWFDKVKINYTMTEAKRFLFGELTFKNNDSKEERRSLKLSDLYLWDRTRSLRKYIAYIRKLIWDSKGNILNTNTAKELLTAIESTGLTKETFNKLEIDYRKVNLHQREDGWYYYQSKEDALSKTNPIKLDFENEAKYLEIDVKSLVVVHKEIELFKQTIKEVLGIAKTIDPDYSLTLPGFGKFIFEEYVCEYMQQSYRAPTEYSDYEEQEWSYTGAFTASNKDFPYLDEELFKSKYPNIPFYDSNNQPIIKCYDVNSLYPSIMVTGLPVGKALPIENPKEAYGEDYTTWYEITFTEKWDTKNWYVWKEPYSYLNNWFFGENFLISFQKLLTQKYVWKPLYEKFMEMCDSHIKVVGVRHQRISHKMTPFINLLYEVKKNNQHIDLLTGKPKKDANGNEMAPVYSTAQKEAVKLLLNSLYGKLGEKFKRYNCQWFSDINKQINKLRKEFPELGDRGTHQFNRKVVYENQDLNCGFIISKNIKKTKDSADNDVRESILAGLYVTQRSRWFLMSALKNEIDQGNIVLNCDTDSLKLIQFKPPKFKVDNYELGAWKYEGSFTHFGHPNKLKKYWLGNKHTGDIKIKCGGVPESSIYDKNDGETYEQVTNKLRIIYDLKNTVQIKNCKPASQRNSSWQTVINRTDYIFRSDTVDPIITHFVINRKIVENNV